MQLTTQAFFNTVLPSKGIYAIAKRTVGNNYLEHRTYHDLNSLLSQVGNIGIELVDYWFALAGFSREREDVRYDDGRVVHRFSRSQDNSRYLRCLFLDIDVGVGKDYGSSQEALLALKQFCISLNLDVPTIVMSGSGGCHLYWAFNTDLDKVQWRKLAVALANACQQLGLRADPSRTKDSASILRVPSSHNWKTGLPNPVKLVHLAAQRPVSYYENILAPYMVAEKQYQDNDVNMDIVNAIKDIDFDALLGGKPLPQIPEIEFKDKRPAAEVVAQCAQLQQQNGASEPVWRGMLATLRHTDGGIEMAHKLSKQDPRYDAYDTDVKLQRLAEKNIAPYTCDTFAQHRPEICAICPHRGMIKSPISVPVSRINTVQVDGAGDVEVVPVEASATDNNPLTAEALGLKPASGIPNYETTDYRVNETGCYVRVEGKGGSEEWWSKFYPYPVYPIQKVMNRKIDGGFEISYVFRKHRRNGHDDFQIMGETLMGQGVNGFLGSVGFLLNAYERKHMVGFMIDLLKEVGSDIEETPVMDSLGWSKDMNTFLLGNKLYKTSGQVVEVSPKGNAATYSAHTKPLGTLQKWKEIANIYNRKGAEWGQTALASAFASPLMPIGSVEKAALLFLTGDKGVGKSTALQLAVSVFGDPTELMINKDDTPLARIAKLGMMSNISAGFDEMTDLSPQEASALAYQITQGRGKDRMGDQGKSLQTNRTYWSCLPIMTANDSIIEALSLHSQDATAQMSRVLEVKVTDLCHLYSEKEHDEARMLLRQLDRNFGTAGDVYMRWVTSNMDTVEKMIYETEKLFLKRTGLGNDFRFYTYMCVRMLVGIIIAKRLGLVDYDINGLYDYLVERVMLSKRRISTKVADTESLLGAYLNEHISERLVVVSDQRPENRPYNPEQGEPNDAGYVLQKVGNGRDLSLRVVRDSGLVYISRKSIKTWCTKNLVSEATFFEQLEKQAVVKSLNKRIDLGRLTQYAASSKVGCVVLEMDLLAVL